MTTDPAPRPESEEEWVKAQQRVFLYLRLMNLPPLESLELTLHALKRASETPGESSPLGKSMHALRQLLSERERGRKADTQTGGLFEILRIPFPAPLGRGYCGGIRSWPPLNRGLMLPEEVH
jgi:hypothetical protein